MYTEEFCTHFIRKCRFCTHFIRKCFHEGRRLRVDYAFYTKFKGAIFSWGAIRRVILETYEAEEEFYDDTVLPDEEADDDPSWITLDEICGMSLVTLVSQGDLFPLIAGFLVFRASDILKKPNIVGEMEKYPGKIGVLYDDLAAGTIGLISALIVNQVMFITL